MQPTHCKIEKKGGGGGSGLQLCSFLQHGAERNDIVSRLRVRCLTSFNLNLAKFDPLFGGSWKLLPSRAVISIRRGIR